MSTLPFSQAFCRNDFRRAEDRKINLHFDFKNFIHNYEPSEWSYEVPEKMLGHRQIVDITDDTTGEVHSIAKKHTPIYVNEVGNNPDLHSNTLIREKNDRSIYYYGKQYTRMHLLALCFVNMSLPPYAPFTL